MAEHRSSSSRGGNTSSGKPRRRRRKRNNKRVAILLVAIAVTFIAIVYVLLTLFIKAPEIPTDTDTDIPVVEELSEEELAALAEEEAQRLEQERLAAEAAAAHVVREDNVYTILVSGVDDGNGGSDTNILFGVDFNAGYIHGVSIPRDTKCYIDGTAYKINAAYNIGGIELMADSISDMLGVPVDFTVEVSLDAFTELVDTIGGVYFDVPIAMDYDDPYQDLSIHFEAGYQWLTGEQALGVVRFRQNNDGTGYGSQDIGRMATQQAFLLAVAQQALTVGNLDKLSNYVSIFEKYVDTDLTTGNLVWLGTQAIGLGSQGLSFSTLAGEWVSPYIYADADSALEVVNTYLNPYVEDRVAADLNVAQ